MNKIIMIFCVLILLGFSLISIKQTSYWKNGGVLFERELEIQPGHGLAAVNAGVFYQNQMNYSLAYKHFEIAIKSPRASYYGYIFKGFLLQKENYFDDAVVQYIHATKQKYLNKQYYLKPLFDNLSWLLYRQKRYQEAILFAEQGKKLISEQDYLDSIIAYATGKLVE